MGRYGKSATGNPLTSLDNKFQTSEERQQKYWLARSFGLNSSWARALRDWRLCRVEAFLKGREFKL